jgi:Virulence-associated protein E-like domain/Bifunctional DNA primase/polymerase, N-terminal/Primase C terminal 1 (PriCT-1)
MATAQTNTLLEAALSYASKGWHVFPCHTPTEYGCSCTKRAACTDIGKHPRTRNGLKDATTVAATLRHWWKMWPEANVAIRTGAGSGLVVLDVDFRKGGAESLLDLEQSYHGLPATPQQLTGNGQHYAFAHPGTHIKNGVEDFASGLDIRGDGGYIIAAPSLHENGKRYVWEVLHDPDDMPLAAVPDWLLALCQEPARQERRDAGAPIPDHQRNKTLFRLGASMRAKGFQEAAIFAALWETNLAQCQPPITEDEVRKIARSDCRYEAGPLPHTENEHRGEGTPDPEKPAWMASLLTLKSGEAKETFNNLVLTLEHLAPWRTDCWYDVVRDCGMVGTAPLDEAQVWSAARAIEPATRMPIRNLKLVMQALRSRCMEHKRDVLQDWLGTLPPWDGEPRLTEWLCDHASVPKTAYTMAVARLLPVSMVARALQPGIQCRSVVIFEGAQDIGKSKLIKTLAGEAWYREVSGTLEGKEAHMLMKGAWVVELSEMDVLLRTEESRVKSFITMCNDEYVPKYANDPVKLARRTILVGTINPEGDGSYLRDQTGSTRYYPVRVGTIALDDITAQRDQLFAEALSWFRAHPADWWQMPDEAAEELALIREARRQEGVYEGPRLQAWLDKVRTGASEVLAPFHTEDALRFCFNIPPERWTPAIKDRVGKAIGKYGWRVKTSRTRGTVQRLWHVEV